MLGSVSSSPLFDKPTKREAKTASTDTRLLVGLLMDRGRVFSGTLSFQ